MTLMSIQNALRHMLVHRFHAAVLATAVVITHVPASASKLPDTIPGPIRAKIIRVIDGDTVVVRAHIWLGQEIETTVRLFGIDAPELRGRCLAESDLALKARDFLADLLASGDILLRDIRFGKYAKRVVARMEAADGRDCASALIGIGLGRAYGGGKRRSWC